VENLDIRLVEISHFGAPAPETRRLVLVAAATALGARDVTRHVLRRVLGEGAPPDLVAEVVLQTYLFAGYPRAINALAELAALAHPAEAPPLDLTAEIGCDRDWLERGEELCRRVYREGYPTLLDLMNRLSPDLGRWMVVEGYGKVLSRPLLDARRRELAAVGALLVLHVPVQLRAHLRGCLNVGTSPAEVDGALRTAAVLLPAALPPALELLAAILESRRDERPVPRGPAAGSGPS
jgi:4-carboxymuconolactone decarboxylase